MWFQLNGDARLGRCDSDNCGGQPIWRLEADGVGSNYCSGCKERINSQEWAARQAKQLNAECEADIERIHRRSTRLEPREYVADQALASGDRNAWRQILGFPDPQ